MNCPRCADAALSEFLTTRGVTVDECPRCRGIWLDGGELFLLSRNPGALDPRLADGFASGQPTGHTCPRCTTELQRVPFLQPKLEVDHCPACAGLWMDSIVLEQVGAIENCPVSFERDRSRPQTRWHLASRGTFPLPNLIVRSATTVVLLVALFGAILIVVVELHLMNPATALGLAVVFAVVDYAVTPWLIDKQLQWFFGISWISLTELPPPLRHFIERIASEHDLRVPQFGLIPDGAPNAFTYGHSPRDMRIVLTQGILDLLGPQEQQAVVAHELAHGKHWDTALMTFAQLIPAAMYLVFRWLIGVRSRGRDKLAAYRLAVAATAYLSYVVSQYLVLWLSRCREYHADRFAGYATGRPDVVASALAKIAYGLARRPPDSASTDQHTRAVQLEAIRPLGIFDPSAARALVTCAGGSQLSDDAPDRSSLEATLQWDLWNPWAKLNELKSTHPLMAHRLVALSEQAVVMGQPPYLVLDRRQPESYWDEFIVDVAVASLPIMLGLAALVPRVIRAALHRTPQPIGAMFFGPLLLGAGLGYLVKVLVTYRGTYFPPLSIAGLLRKIKVSSVRPVCARVRGTVIGRGIPGLIWSEDVVVQDGTGILFADYRQPLRIWEWLFGLFRTGSYVGKTVEIIGWFRRAPLPYIEIKVLTVNGTRRRCYAYHAKVSWGVAMIVSGMSMLLFAD